jgi:tetratricopeptide (TPR) repeat protein
VSDDSHVWADRLDSPATDVFGVQATIAERVAGALDVALATRERSALVERPTSNPDAYDHYLRGLGYEREAASPSIANQDEPRLLRLAVDHYERAVRLDPGFARAHAHLASALFSMHDLEPANDSILPRGREALREAKRIAPDLPETLVASTSYVVEGPERPGRISDVLTRAVAARPSDPDVLMSLAWAQITELDEVDAGFRNIARAVRLDPRSIQVLSDAGDLAKDFRRYDEAESYADRLIALMPEAPFGYDLKIQTVLIGRADTARTRRLLDSAAAGARVSASTRWIAYPFAGTEYRRRFRQLTVGDARGWSDSAQFYRAHGLWAAEEGRRTAARAYFDSARAVLVRGLARPSEFNLNAPLLEATARAELAIADAGVGRRSDAVREIARAEALAPQATRGQGGRDLPGRLARAYALLGDRDSTVVQLERWLKLPATVSPEYFRIAPGLGLVRDHPGFRRLLERKR